MKRLPPPVRSTSPSYDTWRFRVDDGSCAAAASRTIHSLTSFASGECRAPAGSFALAARLRLASCEAPPFEIERATLRDSVCGHVRYILENSKAILRLGHDWKVETTLRTWLRQRFLFAVQIEGLVLQMAAARTHSQQTRRREFEVCDDVLHYGTTRSPFLGVFVVCVHVPVIERFFAGPKAHLVEPSRIVWVYPPGQVVTTRASYRRRVRRERFEWPLGDCIPGSPWTGGSLRFGNRLRRTFGCGSTRRLSA